MPSLVLCSQTYPAGGGKTLSRVWPFVGVPFGVHMLMHLEIRVDESFVTNLYVCSSWTSVFTRSNVVCSTVWERLEDLGLRFGEFRGLAVLIYFL